MSLHAWLNLGIALTALAAAVLWFWSALKPISWRDGPWSAEPSLPVKGTRPYDLAVQAKLSASAALFAGLSALLTFAGSILSP